MRNKENSSKIQDAIAIFSFSVGALLILNYTPIFWKSTEISSILAYALMGFVFLYLIYAYSLPTLRFIKAPRFTATSIFTMAVVVYYVIPYMDTDRPIELSRIMIIQGLVYLFFIGLGEEIVSRGFIFGLLEKYGKWRAIFLSSLAFGLMHLNLYIGADWEHPHAIFHVASTFGFGFFACAVMIGSGSIWPAVILHALRDWTTYFEGDPLEAIEDVAETEPWDFLDIFYTLIINFADDAWYGFVIFFFAWVVKKVAAKRKSVRVFLGKEIKVDTL